MNRIFRFAIYHPFVIVFLAGLTAIFGWLSFRDLPVDAVPDVTNNQVQINTALSGLSTEEAERTVTFPIETAMRGLAGVEQVRSLTRFDISQVTVIFEDAVDTYRARQLVSERLQSVAGALPAGVLPKPGPITSGLGEIFHYAIKPDRVAAGPQRLKQLMEMRTLQDWFVKPRLLTVKGVAEVNTIGGYERQFHVQPRSRDMSRYGIKFADIADALDKTNRNVGGGYVQQTSEQFLVQGVGLLKSVDDIGSVPVKTLENLKTVRVADVAEVRLGTELRTGAALLRGEEVVIGTTLMLLGENSRTVALRVAERISEIQKTMPSGFRIEPLYDRSELVNRTLGTVEHNLFTGAILVIIVLTLLVGNLRAAFITAVTIPITLLVSFVAMRYLDISGNLMSLGALDFGIIVDGTVILLDNCVRVLHDRARELRRTLTADETRASILDAVVEVRTAAGFGELVIVVVFLPLFSLVGVEGKMFRPMAATFIIAILVSLVLSFTLAPALASLMMRGRVEDDEPWIMRRIQALYGMILDRILRRRGVTLACAVALTVVGAVIFSRLGAEFLPQLDEGTLLIQTTRPVTVSIDQSLRLQSMTEKIAATAPEVEYTFSKMGTSQIANDPMGVNQADTYIVFRPEKDWPRTNGRARTRAEIAHALTRQLNAELPGQIVVLSQPIQMRFNDLLEGSKSDVSLKLFGDDLDVLAERTRAMAKVIADIPGSGSIETELRGKSPLLKITPRESMLLRLGVSRQAVLDAINVALGGRDVGFLYDGNMRFPILIRFSDVDRSNLEAVRALPVGIGVNATAPLAEVADIRFDEAYAAIYREDGKRRASVMINPQGRDTEGFVARAQAEVARLVQLPTGYYTEWGGTFKNLQKARERLALLAPLALMLVLAMIYAAFSSVAQTALVFSCVPLALVGGVLGLLASGQPFSISAGVGFIALSGIAVLNGVVLMNFFNQLRRNGLSGDDLVRQGALLRIRPVLMTALVDVLGFMPMLTSHGVGAEVQRPLAAVVVGGIISSTALTLVVMPVLYRSFEERFGRGYARAN